MKDRITRAKAILDLAYTVDKECMIGVLIVANGPNGTLSASCASLLGYAYRIVGETPGPRPCVMQALRLKSVAELGNLFFNATSGIPDLANGSVVLIQADEVEEYAGYLRDVLLKKNVRYLVATCHS